MKNLPIKSWALEDRPREKLVEKGCEVLTNAELLAILIGSGSRNQSALNLCKQILQDVEGDLEKLGRLNVHELMQYKGIGEAKAVSIVAALEIGRRRKSNSQASKALLNSSLAIYEFISPRLQDKTEEECWIIYLNRGLKVIADERISKGGRSNVIIDPKVVFKKALDRKASSIVIVHNHPSNNLKPSKEDFSVTNKLLLVGKSLDLPLIDHLIIGQSDYFSFSDEGLLK